MIGAAITLLLVMAPGAAPAPTAARTTAPPAADPHAGHDMPTPAPVADPHAGHDMTAADTGEIVGTQPAPAPPADHAADAVWGVDAVAPSRAALRREHGNFSGSMILFNIAEYQARPGSDGYRWEGEGWFGGDIDRFVVKTEGEGDVRGPLEDAEIQALYSRAIDPWWNLQAGVRHDFRPDPQRTHAVIGFEGLAPYWFKAAGALFLSSKGELRGRIEGFYDQRITQRLILQPRAEIEASAQSIPEIGVGAGLTDIEVGLRLRYEFAREFAPYVGVEWAAKVGETARYARDAGERASGVSYVAGIRFWF
ncbi:copper resistance protein B [Polymorphobacter fuscus]|uniref:Copper resistance protein B n=1 Tax=Sandarakinorhabdus fusca TaxID=1439888 RepID=A0A7C9KYA6_9SPHN|nr:copper resistance protein B [Polymorphobacter fuscus]KAB7647470.1 copper resistance protein B [Polymorphobacter fuscus]MQT16728.1 copper resistance protein B [Polymorphobacter fuscus]NJC09285.1 copper resistance protein B [Polymorphobacter fuscus]